MTQDSHHGEKADEPSNQEYSEASLNILKTLWTERNQRRADECSAKQIVLQRIWNEIVGETFDRQEQMKMQPNTFSSNFAILDEASVDGAIYQICHEYEKELNVVEQLQWILKPIAFEIISRDFEDFKKAIAFCRYELMSLDGRRRLNLLRIGEK